MDGPVGDGKHGGCCSGGIRLHGQAVKTSPFHGGNTGSIPVGVIVIKYGAVAKW